MKKYLWLLFIMSSSLLAMEENFSISACIASMFEVSYREKYVLSEQLKAYLRKNQDKVLAIEDLQALYQLDNNVIFIDKLRLWLDIYLQNGIEDGMYDVSKDEAFKCIKDIVIKDRDLYNKAKPLGRQMLESYYTPSMIKKVHRSNDQDLIDLFIIYLPLPSAAIFNDGMIPFHIAKREEEKQDIINHFLEEIPDQKQALFRIIYIQRSVRQYLRRNEQRANSIKLLQRINFSEENINKALIDIDYPYLPQCSNKDLARKIVDAASKVKLWSHVAHLAATESLASIFDDGLLGRRNLMNQYMSFSPAALNSADIDNGDGNVVCLGPDKIDSKCYKESTAQIVFDPDSLLQEKNLPCFYKSRDLGFCYQDFQEINLGDLYVSFNQRYVNFRMAQYGYSYFIISINQFDGNLSDYPPSYPNCLHIFHNLTGLDMMLTLYPFRYIDQLGYVKDDIYNALDKLSEAELIKVLTNFGTKATDTAEFNIYGCYLPSIDHILAINFYNHKKLVWEMPLKDLYEELNQGITKLFDNLKVDMPSLLKSHRFMDHLLGKIDHEGSKNMLLELRKQI